ncbi:hypothetical protein [Sinosporangium siamense]|nr:hypothetical protein [Sinosporangium siamense]
MSEVLGCIVSEVFGATGSRGSDEETETEEALEDPISLLDAFNVAA